MCGTQRHGIDCLICLGYRTWKLAGFGWEAGCKTYVLVLSIYLSCRNASDNTRNHNGDQTGEDILETDLTRRTLFFFISQMKSELYLWSYKTRVDINKLNVYSDWLTFCFDTMFSLVYRLILIYSLAPFDLEHSDTFVARSSFLTFVIDDQ